ncbi:Homoserine/homoserine lactone efflux protein [Acinetobacter oleivorans]|jgi:threonine/homoserine/homoserine lactone efflux protein|uniref:LysE family translocator n=1 Tax=Acinetobacter oleivorans TaxID=1148157 RepID=UPI0021F01ED7|nr:Homoserine/homoserine lactone efflux protein [Acinetobacter oleivorans]CAI3119577.1 Homoserine/homoserine lactone efflux protein [Acinetobacter oleivorans]CAI3119655.1 Homoserine/homoserine lactone efflux protein [Acinetobacter oleivorans]CAI3120085.1 Homoserine/homoserine lactone efflux protein [Acinetobacter oleivorans]CAI3120091.1 Homoserine/homoserine lactone efflux protein [Acinetobacter oleivorans]
MIIHTPSSGLVGLIITSSILIAIPGPSIMFFISQVLTEGRSNALRSVIGNAIGMFCVAVILSLGIGSLILKSNIILSGIKILGVIILLLIGIQYLKASSKAITSNTGSYSKNSQKSVAAGVIVGMTNPKAFIMFGVIVPSFLSDDFVNPTYSLMIYSLVPIILGIFIDCIWVAVAHIISSRFFSNTEGMRTVNLVGGILIILMALILAWETISDL